MSRRRVSRYQKWLWNNANHCQWQSMRRLTNMVRSLLLPFSQALNMNQQCALCGKVFTNRVSVDKHGSYCAKKHKTRLVSPSIASTSAVQGEGSQKRARIDDVPIEDGAADQAQVGNNDPGPSDAEIGEDSPPAT